MNLKNKVATTYIASNRNMCYVAEMKVATPIETISSHGMHGIFIPTGARQKHRCMGLYLRAQQSSDQRDRGISIQHVKPGYGNRSGRAGDNRYPSKHQNKYLFRLPHTVDAMRNLSGIQARHPR